MTTVIMPVPQNIPTCPDCRQELPDYKAEYCGTCHQEIYEESDTTWGDIILGITLIIGIIIGFFGIAIPVISWLATEDTTLAQEFVNLFEAFTSKIKTIW